MLGQRCASKKAIDNQLCPFGLPAYQVNHGLLVEQRTVFRQEKVYMGNGFAAVYWSIWLINQRNFCEIGMPVAVVAI
jgi:hypothetical protein